MGDKNMSIALAEARKILLAHALPLGGEEVALLRAHRRVSAVIIRAPFCVPRYDHSAMDGFAVRAADTVLDGPRTLRVVGRLLAGDEPQQRVGLGEAVRIMTGAPLPEGADAVIPFEDTDVTEEGILVRGPTVPSRHVRRAGEEYEAGAVAIEQGTRMRAAELALCAAFGMTSVPVTRRPRIGVVSTGSELVEVGQTPAAGQVVNSNAIAIAAMVEHCGGVPVSLGIVRDERAQLEQSLHQVDSLDALVSTGGVSGGDRDYVCDAVAATCEVHHRFNILMKPGKPFGFGVRGGRMIFALAGNPAAAMVAFEQLVAPVIRKLCGQRTIFNPTARALLDGTVREAHGRIVFVRAVATFRDGRLVVTPLPHQGAGAMRSMLGVNALIVVQPGSGELRTGAEVDVELLGD